MFRARTILFLLVTLTVFAVGEASKGTLMEPVAITMRLPFDPR